MGALSAPLTPRNAHRGRLLYEREVKRRILQLREDLVRHDENLCAYELLSRCIPYFLAADAEIEQAREDQAAMVRHVIDPEAAYEPYYAANAHERPFEEQYGIEVAEAHEHLYRIAFLRERLPEQAKLIDLAANDGFMAANLSLAGHTTDCVDLNPANVALAKQRRHKFPGIGKVVLGDLHEAARLLDDAVPVASWRTEHGYDAVVCFEVVEHVPDPDAMMRAAVSLCNDTGRVYVSTPCGAVEGGDLPEWDRVEPKGHVRTYSPELFAALLERHGEVASMVLGPDGVLVAEVRPDSPS